MYAAYRYGASAYVRVGLETGVIAASPHKLILMLFEGARIALSLALTHMKNGEINAKGEAISKAIAIISSGLQTSLDVKAGGELAQQLSALYDYMNRRLLQANLHNKPEHIEEVARLLGELNEAWEAIGLSSSSGSLPGSSSGSLSDSSSGSLSGASSDASPHSSPDAERSGFQVVEITGLAAGYGKV